MNMKNLKTRWTDQVLKNPTAVLNEYPRPTMVRKSYVNLNGLWDYAITQTKDKPQNYDGKILVPFSPESYLSGVKRQLQPTEYLWYRRTLPKQVTISENRKRWILHFGAVDQIATIYLNGVVLIRNTGGYLPFSVDVTEALNPDDENELVVRVQDTSDTSYHSRGKQKLARGGMYYTAQSGIWQTVWMEQVPENHIGGLEVNTNYDQKSIEVVVLSNTTSEIAVEIPGMLKIKALSNEKREIKIPQMHSWSPEDPFLYKLKIALGEDEVESYFAMRKISVEKDENQIPRVFLNNKPYFQKGLLDQGYWPDGLYTAPTDEAMIFDISEMKRLGFNMLRKHCKIEPERWYYHCDQMGMLVWQDMVNGGSGYKDWYVTYLATVLAHTPWKPKDKNYHLLSRGSDEGRKEFEQEVKDTVSYLKNHPSIVTWTIFNEGWGQFDAERITKDVKKMDSSRLVDHASGWFDQGAGDYQSIHEYFLPLKFKQENERVTALTEYGGYSWHVPLHSACKAEYGYKKFEDRKSLSEGYECLICTDVLPNIKNGLSATIYTQVSDIEEETNGIYTYDREVLKLSEEVLEQCNKEVDAEFYKVVFKDTTI